MQKNGVVFAPSDLSQFDENRSTFPTNKLLLFAGQQVAWSLDGTRIVAAAATRDDHDRRLESVGIDLGQVMHDYIDPLE